MQLNGKTPGINHHVPAFDKASFLENFNLVLNDIIDAVFFSIMKGSYAPAEAKLVDQCFFL